MAAYLQCDFKPTPMIFGAEGKRFLESVMHPKKISGKERERMKKNYESQQLLSEEEIRAFFNGK